MFNAPLIDRAALRISGRDAADFLQGLITGDIRKVMPSRGIYSALLTPQGKFLHDFFIYPDAGDFLLETESQHIDALIQKLSLYRLRSEVTIRKEDTYIVIAGWGNMPDTMPSESGEIAVVDEAIIMRDPRYTALGVRVLTKRHFPLSPESQVSAFHHYAIHRTLLGIPDGSKDMEREKDILLEWGIDTLNGVDFQKGCYMGQELTARTKYRGLVKKHGYRVSVEAGQLPAYGTPVMLDGEVVGELRSNAGNVGLALIRDEAVKKAEATEVVLTAMGQPLCVTLPDWLRLEVHTTEGISS